MLGRAQSQGERGKFHVKVIKAEEAPKFSFFIAVTRSSYTSMKGQMKRSKDWEVTSL